MNNLIQFITTKVPLEKELIEQLLALCIEKKYAKGEPLLKIGGYCNHLFFINNGLVKLCFEADEGEFIMRFFQENILFTELESLTTRHPSKYTIVALEHINSVIIPYSKFEKLCREYPKLSIFYNKFLTIAHINMMNRISEMLDADARTRYNNFLNRNSAIINRITLGDLSKYLGINQVTLSRIRRKK
ncbi:MAG: Crp/Fnr family transcriptional regulator [Aureispira sp.]